MDKQHKKLLFITGTGTDVGKTFLSAALLHLARENKLNAAYFKPIQCGSDPANQWTDAQRVASFFDAPPICETGLFLPDPVSPHLALKKSGEVLNLEQWERTIASFYAEFDLTVIEGAGGIKVPLSPDLDFVDWLTRLKKRFAQLQILVCASPLLGTLNHTLLTLDALKNAGLTVAGFVFGKPKPQWSPLELEVLLDSALTIEKKSSVPFLGLLPDMSKGMEYKDWVWHPLNQWMSEL